MLEINILEWLSQEWWVGIAANVAIIGVVVALVFGLKNNQAIRKKENNTEIKEVGQQKVYFLFLYKKIKEFLLKPWLLIITGIIGITVILVLVIPKIDFPFPRKVSVYELKIEADSVFNLGEFEQAYQLYEKIKQKNDNAGYDMFYNIAKNMYEIDNKFDGNIKILFEYAQKLDNTTEVNELLNKCEQKINVLVKGQNYLELATSAFEKGNFLEAMSYYQKYQIFPAPQKDDVSEKIKQADMWKDCRLDMGRRTREIFDNIEGWHHRFRHEVTNRVKEEIFKPLFSERTGAPNAPIRILVAMMALKEGLGISDEQLYE